MNASPRRGRVEAAAVAQHVVDHRLADDLRQELVHDQPLVVPRREPARLREHVHRVAELALLADVVDRVVVEEQERAVQPGDDQVLVVARIADDRGPSARRGRSSNSAAALDLELDRGRRVVQLLLGDRAGAVDRVEVERRRAGLRRILGVGRAAPASRSRRRSCRGRGTGRGTSSLRCESGCWGCSRSARGRRSVPSARPRADRRRRAGRPACRARSAPPRRLGLCSANGGNSEDPPEVVGAGGRRCAGARPLTRRRDGARRVDRHGTRACAHSTQEPPAAEPVLVLRGHRCCPSSRRRGPKGRSARDPSRARCRRGAS